MLQGIRFKEDSIGVEGGDIWDLTVDGAYMQGTAQKAGGGTYALNFTRSK